jgi:hypothetical protein
MDGVRAGRCLARVPLGRGGRALRFPRYLCGRSPWSFAPRAFVVVRARLRVTLTIASIFEDLFHIFYILFMSYATAYIINISVYLSRFND